MTKPFTGLFRLAASAVVGYSLLIPAISFAATTFSSQSYPTGAGPQAVASGDLNGDGYLDLATADIYGSSISVLLNDGSGAYIFSANIPMTQPHDVKIVDINGDGKLDVVTESEGNGGDVEVMLGHGDGTFDAPISTTLSHGGASGVVVADINGDGNLDALVPIQDYGLMKILLGDGTGHFPTVNTISVAGGVNGLALADMNGDGTKDLFADHSADNNVGIMLGNGDGTFGPQTTFTTGVAGGNGAPGRIADFNGDGNQDVVFAAGPGVLMMLGDGNGGLATASLISAGPQGPIDAADITGDGKADVEVSDVSANIVLVLVGNGDGTFTPSANFPTGAYPIPGGVVKDLNNDGKLDIAVPDLNDNTVTVLLNTTPPTTGTLVMTKYTIGADGQFFFTSPNPEIGAFPLNVTAGIGIATFEVPPGTYSINENVPGGWTMTGNTCVDVVVTAGNTATCTVNNTLNTSQLTALAPAKVWVGLKNSDDVGTKFDLMAEAYLNGSLIGSGTLNSVNGGSSGFNNAKLNTIPLTLSGPVEAPSGSTLATKVYVRNTCTGPSHNSGTARLWYDGSDANSSFGVTIADTDSTYYLRNAFALSTTAGTSKKSIDVAAGAKCSPFKLFGTWATTTP